MTDQSTRSHDPTAHLRYPSTQGERTHKRSIHHADILDASAPALPRPSPKTKKPTRILGEGLGEPFVGRTPSGTAVLQEKAPAIPPPPKPGKPTKPTPAPKPPRQPAQDKGEKAALSSIKKALKSDPLPHTKGPQPPGNPQHEPKQHQKTPRPGPPLISLDDFSPFYQAIADARAAAAAASSSQGEGSQPPTTPSAPTRKQPKHSGGPTASQLLGRSSTTFNPGHPGAIAPEVTRSIAARHT